MQFIVIVHIKPCDNSLHLCKVELNVYESFMFYYLLASDPCYNGGENKWTAKTDVYANSSLSIKNARTLEACRQSCVSNPECNGIEYKGSVSSGKCWILNHLEKPQLLPASGIIHETLERCVIADIGKYNGNNLFNDMLKIVIIR